MRAWWKEAQFHSWQQAALVKVSWAHEITDMKVVFGARNGTHLSIDIKEEIILVSVDTAQAHFQ